MYLSVIIKCYTKEHIDFWMLDKKEKSRKDFCKLIRASGGIGRRARLKIWWW